MAGEGWQARGGRRGVAGKRGYTQGVKPYVLQILHVDPELATEMVATFRNKFVSEEQKAKGLSTLLGRYGYAANLDRRLVRCVLPPSFNRPFRAVR